MGSPYLVLTLPHIPYPRHHDKDTPPPVEQEIARKVMKNRNGVRPLYQRSIHPMDSLDTGGCGLRFAHGRAPSGTRHTRFGVLLPENDRTRPNVGRRRNRAMCAQMVLCDHDPGFPRLAPQWKYRAESFSETRFHRHQTFKVYPQADTGVR